jgi:cytidylate kinase
MAILTISRQLGSGGREIGQAIASSLGYEYIDKQRFLCVLKGVDETWEQYGKELDEKPPSLLDKYGWSFAAFRALFQSIVLKCALGDNVTLMGRGANFLLKGMPHAYRIRVVAPSAARIERIAFRESIDFDSARWLIERTDRERAASVYSLFGKSWDDPAEFDEVFDTGERPIEHIIAHVTERLVERDLLKSAEAENLIRMRAAAAEVKARLFLNPSTFVPTLEVEFDGRELVLTGIVRGPKHFQRIDTEARRLAKGCPLRCEMRYRW